MIHDPSTDRALQQREHEIDADRWPDETVPAWCYVTFGVAIQYDPTRDVSPEDARDTAVKEARALLVEKYGAQNVDSHEVEDGWWPTAEVVR